MGERNNYLKLWLRNVDQGLIIAVVILFIFSFILVTTSSPAVAARIGLDDRYFVSRQIIYLIISLILIIVFSCLEKKWLKRISILGLAINVGLLIMVKFYGYEVKGATRWINILGFSLQPSEFIKPFFEVVVGWLLSLKFEGKFPGFYTSSIIYAFICLFLIMQPDFGMFVMLTAVFGMQLFVAGMPLFWIALIVLMSVLGTVGAYFWLPHVSQRINSFLDPETVENYQVSKSIMAFEHGGMYGCGPGEGTVKQILPDSHSDFIFAVAGEEFGAIVCLVIIWTFAFMVLKVLFKLVHEPDKFTQLAAAGIIGQFGIQSVINIGVTLNLLPTKGMTLPFISYGGSSTLAISLAMGILLGLLHKRTSLSRYKFQNIDI